MLRYLPMRAPVTGGKTGLPKEGCFPVHGQAKNRRTVGASRPAERSVPRAPTNEKGAFNLRAPGRLSPEFGRRKDVWRKAEG